MSLEYVPVATELPLLGARLEGDGTRFGLFAQPARSCAVRLLGSTNGGRTGDHALQALGDGYFGAFLPGVREGARYMLIVDGRELPDPYARFLPDGVHGPAQVVGHRFAWRNGPGRPRGLSEQVIYELHVGTFTELGTYDGVCEQLPYLAGLGVTTIELLPLAAFAGRRGWGYEGVALFAPFAPYGTPDELRRLVDAAHGAGLSVLLDVVYNHFGPAGNYLPSYSPAYFTSRRRSAWGDALNFAHPTMRRMVIENALYWLTEFRFDGLRLDATHAITDDSSPHILRELSDAVRALSPGKVLVAEDERNDPTLVTSHGLDGIWADDFHHQLRVSLTGEQDGYYAAYRPGLADLARAINRGWLYEGAVYRPTGRRRGAPADALEASAFVYCIQNHDQVGNRALGDRLSGTVTSDQYRAASTLLLFLPMTPLLFMGQEWAASSPFQFFTDHEPELGRLVCAGRREEFKAFPDFSDPRTRVAIPDPQAPETFTASRLRWDERDRGEHARVLSLYRTLLWLRASDPVLQARTRRHLTADVVGQVLLVRVESAAGVRVLLMNLGATPVAFADLPLQLSAPAIIFRSDLQKETQPVVPPQTALILSG